jgi:hypothetical protein
LKDLFLIFVKRAAALNSAQSLLFFSLICQLMGSFLFSSFFKEKVRVRIFLVLGEIGPFDKLAVLRRIPSDELDFVRANNFA